MKCSAAVFATAVIMSSGTQASDRAQFKLFFDTASTSDEERASEDIVSGGNASGENTRETSIEPLDSSQSSSAKQSAAQEPVAEPLIHVLYNGFISSSEGSHFFVNGKRLSDLVEFQLLSVGQGGRSLVLKTISGKRFHISIGEVRSFQSL